MMTGRHIEQGLEGLPRLVSLVWPLDEARQDDADLARGLNEQLLDRLESAWGRGRSSYQAAPFLADAHPAAGWQDPRSPREFASALLLVLDEKGREIAGRPFSNLDDETAEAILVSVTAGDAPSFSLEASTGFRVLRQLIYDILFSDTWERPAIGWDWLDGDVHAPVRA